MSIYTSADNLLVQVGAGRVSSFEAVRTVPNFAQLIMLAYGTCASESAKICRHSVGAKAPESPKIRSPHEPLSLAG